MRLRLNKEVPSDQSLRKIRLMSFPTRIFVPGFLCDRRLWSHQATVLSPEAPARFVDLRHASDLEEMLSIVGGAAHECTSDPVDLIGFSMGGYVSQVFAARFPDRVRSLTLVAATGGPLSAGEIRARETMAALLEKSAYRGISDRELARYLSPAALADASIANVVRAMCADNTSEMYLRQMRATLHRESPVDALNRAHFSITLVAGREDRVVPLVALEKFRSEIPRAKLEIVAESGHYVPLEKPEALNAILELALD